MKLFFKIIGYSLLGLIAMSLIGQFLLHSSSSGTAPSSSTKPKTTLASKPNWEYSESQIGIDKIQTFFASSESTNSLNLSFPYNGINKGHLVARNSKKNGVDLIFRVDKGQFRCDLYTCSGKIKLDDAPSKSFTAATAADNSSGIMFFNAPRNWIAIIQKAKHITIEVPMFQEGNQLLEFDVSGLEIDQLKLGK